MKRIFWIILICVSSYLFLIRAHVVVNAATTCPSGSVWNITDFGANGNDSADDYDALLQASQCASNKENITLYFPAGHYYIKQYRIIGVTSDGRQPNGVQDIVYQNCNGLRIIGAGKDKTIIDVKGDYKMAADVENYDGAGEGHSRSYSMDVTPFWFNNCSNVYLGGFELDGNFDQTIVDPSIFQPHTNMGVFVHGTSNFTLANLNVHHFAEDGVYLGGGNIDRNGFIYQVDSHHNGRQGMSITNARGITVVNSGFRYTAYDGSPKRFAPGCGVDIEPDSDPVDQPNNRVGDILFVQNQYGGNWGGGAAGDGKPDVCQYPSELGRVREFLPNNSPITISQSINYALELQSDSPGRCINNAGTDYSTFYFSQNWCDYNNGKSTINALNDLKIVNGNVKINLTTSGMSTIQYFLDDSPITGVVPAGAVTIDTTQYTNGKHVLYAAATSTGGTKANYDPMVLIIVNLPDSNPTPVSCSSSTISSSTISSSNLLTVTMTANKPVKSFWLAFYNPDNLYGPGNPKPIYFEAGKQFSISKEATSLTQTMSFTVNYADINKPDLNNNNQKPTNIQVNGYFLDPETKLTSPPNINCVVQFNVTRPGDLNGDGNVDSTDFNKMVSNFGHPYTIFDYNILVGNFGK